MSWALADYGDLHVDLRLALPPLLEDAEKEGLRVRRISGYRSNARQAQLRATFEAKEKLYQLGQGPMPLPAARPGKSAHNYALCSRTIGHVIGEHVQCPICGAATLPASVAVDIGLFDDKGVAIRCPPLFEERPAEWQAWAGLVAKHPDLRDGGHFKPNADPVHVELIGWNWQTCVYTRPL